MRSRQRVIEIIAEPKGKIYRALIDYAMRECKEFILVVGLGTSLQASGQKILSLLEPCLIKKAQANEWPGTQMAEAQAMVHHYRCDNFAAGILKEAVDGLFSWRQPGYPEDPCFLKAGGLPWLVTIAHEREAFFKADPSEIPHLRKNVPGLKVGLSQHNPAAVLGNYAEVLRSGGRIKEANAMEARAKKLRSE